MWILTPNSFSTFVIMSFSSNFRPTLPPIRDVFRDELSWKVPPSLTAARPWNGYDQEARPFPAHHPTVPPFRYSDTECHGTSCTLLHNYQLSDEHIFSRLSLVQPGPSNSSMASSKNAHQVLPKNPLHFAKPRYLRRQSISTATDTEDAEAHQPTPAVHFNSDAFAYPPPSFIHGVRHERRNSSANYECSYCGKLFNRPSSLKIHSNSHTGEKPFACPVQDCGRSFSVLSNMRRHSRVHNSHAVSLTESASDHCPPRLPPTSSNSAPIQSHR